MRKTLEDLLERAAGWSEEAQADLVAAMLEIESRHQGAYRLSADERAAVLRGLAEARAGNYATDEEISRVLRRHRPA